MATPIGVSNNVDMGGDVLCVKYVRTGYNNPGVLSGTANTTSGSAPLQITNTGTALTITPDLHLGTLILMNSATAQVTLPAATGTGNTYEIAVSVNSTASLITAAGSDKLYGFISIGSTTTALTSVLALNNNVSVAMNGTTTGGVKGSVFYFTDLALNTWMVEANVVGSGTTVITGIT